MWFLPALAASFDQHDSRFYPPGAIEERIPTAAIADFGFGSGFVLSDGHTVITCGHVGRSFGSHGTISLGRGTPAEHVVTVDVWGFSAALDLALYRSQEDLGAGFSVRDTPPIAGEPILVVGHPGGESVRASYGQILRADIEARTVPAVSYDARTDWGSSGSVVLDTQGHAIAIHWAWDHQGLWGGFLLGVSLREAAGRWPMLAASLSPTGEGEARPAQATPDR